MKLHYAPLVSVYRRLLDKRCLGAMWQAMTESTGIGLGSREEDCGREADDLQTGITTLQPAASKAFGSPDADSGLGYIQPTRRVPAGCRLGRSWSRGSRWPGLVVFAINAVSRYHQEALGLLISHNRCNARVRLGVACDEWCAGQTHANGSVSILECIVAISTHVPLCDKKLQPEPAGWFVVL